MTQCQNCGYVYDESDDPVCPICGWPEKKRHKMIIIKRRAKKRK